MTQPVVAARDDATLEEIARLMVEHGVGAVPIVDQSGDLCGIVTESDFVGKEATLPSSRYGYRARLPRLFGHWLLPGELEAIYAAVRETRAAHVMSAPVVTATESEPLQTVVERMVHHDVNRIPVVRDRKPIGMIARHDLLNLVVDRL